MDNNIKEIVSRDGYYLTQCDEVGDDRIYIKAIKGVNVNESDWREATEEEKIAFETEQEAKRQEELDTNDALATQRKNLILRN